MIKQTNLVDSEPIVIYNNITKGIKMMTQKFSNDFKQTIVDLYNSGKGVTELSREYGISIPTIYHWIHVRQNTNTNQHESKSEDIESLKREISRLKEENEILKKATHHFRKRN